MFQKHVVVIFHKTCTQIANKNVLLFSFTTVFNVCDFFVTSHFLVTLRERQYIEQKLHIILKKFTKN